MTETPSTTEPALPDGEFEWHKLIDTDALPVDRVTTVTIGHDSLCVTRTEAGFGCVDNACPHQGGPLGEGSIEKGWLRCPWHGYDYSPKNGQSPGAHGDAPDAFRTEVRDDGVYVALPVPVPRPRTVADVMVETMVNWGVTHVFGMVGHSNLGLADAFRLAEQRGDLTYVGIRHEGAAAFAAGAYGKLTGQLAACFGIAGPGSTNLLTGLYDAKEDRAPVLALSGQVPSKVRGRGAFQDTDLAAAFADVAAFSQTVAATSQHAELMTLACKTALIERNVAHLIFPDEVQPMAVADDTKAGGPEGRTGSRRIGPPDDQLAAAVKALATATRPVFVLGAGARDGIEEVIALAETVGAPVVTTFKAKGMISDHHELGAGVLGRSGTPIASWMMNECDLLVVWGASFSDHTGIAPYKPIVQVDYDPMALGRFHPVEVPVQGHVGVTAAAMRVALPTELACVDQRAEVAERWSIWRDEKAGRREDVGAGVSAAVVFDRLSELVPADAVIPVDVGNNTYSFGRYFEVKQQSVVMSGYLGSIGFAFPASMGAWAAFDGKRPIVSISGDGGFGQYAMDFTTAVKYGMNLTHVVLDNNELGKISKEQRAAKWDVWQTSLHNPDFAAYADLCGGKGFRVTVEAELDDAINGALAYDGPALIAISTDPFLI